MIDLKLGGYFFLFISNHMSLCQRKNSKIPKIRTTLYTSDYESDLGQWLLVSRYLKFCKINKIWIEHNDTTRNRFNGSILSGVSLLWWRENKIWKKNYFFGLDHFHNHRHICIFIYLSYNFKRLLNLNVSREILLYQWEFGKIVALKRKDQASITLLISFWKQLFFLLI